VQQGLVVLGLRSDTHAVLVALRRSPSDLAHHQEKLFRIDAHMGIGVSGLIADGRRLCKYMRNETLNYRYVYNKAMPLSRLVLDIADKQQVQTQISSGRPYGVGLLIIGYDETGPHLYETDPSGHFYEYFAHAIGARDQAAKTYLEKEFEKFPGSTWQELVQHGVNALKETVRTKNIKLTTDNTAVMLVGEDREAAAMTDEALEPFIAKVEAEEEEDEEDKGDGQKDSGATQGGPEPMEVDE